ncbi:hypothetical protein [Thiocapsa bogorovii]|uniref:hypothetical protein n=1 Tax=Thiocapsa bogorovii TaxID=521689 RepID=UPI001E48E26B|nr:hypothetical protein [Thiocapsa bogorovii]UHD16108.1 hypothetical protein LT988_23135 [Thiocapsa bogorovii]
MKSEFVAAREFVRGIASRRDRVFVISKGKALLKQDIAHTSVVGVEAGQWVDCVDSEWDSSAIAVARAPSTKLIVIGEDGDVLTYLGGGLSEKEKLSPDPIMIRNARGISGYIFACGMSRQVYKRVDEHRWVDMSASRPGDTESLGFEAIDGYAENEIYAVGWGGEIWEFDGSNWHNRNSPTSVILTGVCCAPDDMVYVTGQQGVLIRGRNDSWDTVPWDDEVTVDLWDMCWFQDRLYVATLSSLYTLIGNRLVEVDFGDIPTPTCFSLTTVEGVLWSIGRDDVVSFDGNRWTRYD